MDASSTFATNQTVLVETRYFGIIRARIIGYYPHAIPPYANLWLLEGYPAFYTSDLDRIHRLDWQDSE